MGLGSASLAGGEVCGESVRAPSGGGAGSGSGGQKARYSLESSEANSPQSRFRPHALKPGALPLPHQFLPSSLAQN